MCFSKLSTLASFLCDIRDGILFYVHIIKTFTFVWIMTGGTRVFAIYPDRYLMGHFALDFQRALHFRNFNLALSISLGTRYSKVCAQEGTKCHM